MTWLRGDGVYGNLGSKLDSVSVRTTRLMQRFVEDNLPPLPTLEEIEVRFPWNRMFESDIIHEPHREIPYFKQRG